MIAAMGSARNCGFASTACRRPDSFALRRLITSQTVFCTLRPLLWRQLLSSHLFRLQHRKHVCFVNPAATLLTAFSQHANRTATFELTHRERAV